MYVCIYVYAIYRGNGGGIEGFWMVKMKRTVRIHNSIPIKTNIDCLFLTWHNLRQGLKNKNMCDKRFIKMTSLIGFNTLSVISISSYIYVIYPTSVGVKRCNRPNPILEEI